LAHDLYTNGINVVAAPVLVGDCIQDLFIYSWDTKEKSGRTDNIKFYLFTALKRRILVKTAAKQKKDSFLKMVGIIGEKPDFSTEVLNLSCQSVEDQSDRLEKALLALRLIEFVACGLLTGYYFTVDDQLNYFSIKKLIT
jgi:hypothetical protein